MAFDYSTLKTQTVEKLIQEFGKDGQLSVNVPATGSAPYESQIDGQDLHAVTLIQIQFKKDNNRGTLVQKDDVLYIVSTNGVTIDPAMADRIIVDNTYQIVRIDPLKPGPLVMLWYIHGRK